MTNRRLSSKPSTQAEKIQDLEAGDEAVILNGNRTRVKDVTVVSSQDGIIKVSYLDSERGEFIYDFDAETGLAVRDEQQNIDKGTPALTLSEDPRVQVIRQRARHRDFRSDIEPVINAFNREPTQEAYEAVLAYVREWGEHSIGLDLTSTIGDIAGEETDTRRKAQRRDLTTDPIVQQHNANISRMHPFRAPGF